MFRTPVVSLVFVACLSVAPAALADEKPLWQIGQSDRSYAEFALARDYNSFPDRFGRKPLVFVVGKSDAAKDWPWIHPGPADHWAHARVHPFTIRFRLEAPPRGLYRLRVEFADVQAMTTPAYSIAINGKSGRFSLRPGGGDGSLSDPKLGKYQKIDLALPAAFLRQGDNDIVLSCLDGSWVQYDAIALFNDPEAKTARPEVQNVSAAATPFFLRQDGKVRRAVAVSVSMTAPADDLSLHVQAGRESFDVPVKDLSVFGSASQEIGVPDSAEPMDVTVTARTAAGAKSTTVKVLPQRKWRVYAAASSHTDIGYTHVQPECAERHNQNADLAVEMGQKYPDFKWNLEVGWQAENYLASRKGEKLEAFLKMAREGRMGVQGLYCNILTGLCSGESACRQLYFTHSLKTRYGIPFTSAMISDVPTQEATMPTILAGSGIRYFSSGINNDRAYTMGQMQSKCPCWWEGPDGSRVLMMYMHGYAHVGGLGLEGGLEAARSRVMNHLRGYEGRKDYPFDAVFLHGAVSDNCLFSHRMAETVKAWNDCYEFPKIILCHNAEFFEYIEKTYGDKLPVFRGSAGTYWEDGAGSSAAETALCRNAKETINTAERLLAMARRAGSQAAYPAAELYAAWRNCLLYDEHTWGAHCSISQPDSAFTKSQWKIKAQFAVDADAQSRALLGRAAAAMTALVKTDGLSLIVVNPSSWPRSDVVRVKLPQGMGLAEGGLACWQDGDETLVEVRDVPACGYRVLKIAPKAQALDAAAPAPDAAPAGEANVIESHHYRVTFDPASGGVASLLDKQLNRELVDAKAAYRLNQYLYVSGGDGTRIVANPGGPAPVLTVHAPQKAALRRVSLGSLGERMIVQTSAQQTPKIVAEVTAWNHARRVDFVNRLNKTMTYKKEAAYFAFPFAAAKPTIRYECPAGVVDAGRDMLPGACLDWFTVQHFVEVDAGEAAVAWATPDAPLVCLQDINRGKWQTRLPMENGHVFAYAMNNYWHTNYKAGQDGDFVFRFAVTSCAKSDRSASARFGWDASNPLLAATAQANLAGVLAGPTGSLAAVAEPNVILIGAKQAESGSGLILRLWETTGQATTAHIRLNSPASKASACNLVEEVQGDLEIKEGTVAVPLRANGLATVRVE